MFLQSLKQREPGQAVVIVALAFVLLVGCLGLALDGANAFGQRRLVGNATDAASIAATRTLASELANPVLLSYRSSGGTAIRTTIEDFLTSRNDLGGATLTWRAFYVDRLDPEGSMGEVVIGGRPPTGADGVRVETTIEFPTYFMAALGQRTLNVSGAGTSVYGPLGTAIGQDLVPLALSNTAEQKLKDEVEVDLDLRGYLASLPPPYLDPLNPDLGFDPTYTFPPSDVIASYDIIHVSFAEVTGAPATGDDCMAGTPVDSLTYWWCNGSPNKLRFNRQLPNGGPDYNFLNPTITWRRDNRNILVMPVWAYGIDADGNLQQEIKNFIAAEIVSFDSTTGVLRLRHLPNYATAGAMLGEGSGVPNGVWAVNLKR
jgi:hypothetical protein